MIRPVAKAEEGRTVYGLTIRGIAVLAAGLGVIFAALALSVVALRATADSTRNRIQTSCQEANQRHREALPQIAALVRNNLPKDAAARAAQQEALGAIGAETSGQTNLEPPKTLEGRRALEGIKSFTQVIAPSYDCKARVAKLAK